MRYCIKWPCENPMQNEDFNNQTGVFFSFIFVLVLQSRGQTQKSEAEALLQESVRTRDELKSRAQEAVRQWRAKCRRLQKELEEARADAQFHTDKASQVSGGGRHMLFVDNNFEQAATRTKRPEDKQTQQY